MNLKVNFETFSKSLKNVKPHFVRVTSSMKEETCTISLNFYHPTKLFDLKTIFKESNSIKVTLNINYNGKRRKYISENVNIIWLKGKPYILEVIFLITCNQESLYLTRKLECFF